jgi:hypothetical protein
LQESLPGMEIGWRLFDLLTTSIQRTTHFLPRISCNKSKFVYEVQVDKVLTIALIIDHHLFGSLLSFVAFLIIKKLRTFEPRIIQV